MTALGAFWMVAVVSLLNHANGQLMFGLGQIDYTDNEPDGVTVEVIKSGSNVGDLIINVAPLTYTQLESMGLPIPSDIGPGNRPDPAEFDLVTGKQDFNNTAFQVLFPATTSTAQVEENILISFFNDEINEQTEGLYLLATVDRVLSNDMDAQQAVAIRNGVALVNINDDDVIRLTFEQLDFTVQESDGLIDNLINVVKQDGMVSEQSLRALIQVSAAGNDPATRGPLPSGAPFDFSLPALDDIQSTTIELVFEVTDSRLNISIDIINDLILEADESFSLLLSIPQNPADNLLLGDISQTTILIDDDEVVTVGFEQDKYNVFENETFVEVCVSASGTTEIAPEVVAFLFARTVDGTAQNGSDFEQLTAGSFNGDDIALMSPVFRGCARLSLIDDSVPEGTETLQLFLVTDDMVNGFVNANFMYDPRVTEVCILDDDELPTIAPSSSVPSTSVPVTPLPSMTPTMPTTTDMGMGGDPHYSILLPTGQLLCYSVHGEHDFAFNLISNKMLQMNALFVADTRREEVTWIGELGVVVQHGPRKRANTTALRFCATESMICVGDKIKLQANGVEKMSFSKGKLSISERKTEGEKDKPSVLVEFPDVGVSFTVTFVRGKHLDMTWNKVETMVTDSHGMIGQFFRAGVEIDETRRLLLLPDMEPVSVMRKPVWHFMERESPDEQLCWVAMNPGYQGKKLLQGHYLDYLVDDVLSTNFKFKPKKH